MIAYCDTSFFLRQLIESPDRARAIEVGDELQERFGSIPITSFTRFECIQALRFEAWLYRNDRSKGLPPIRIETALNIFLAQMGITFKIEAVQWELAIAEAERLSRGTSENGWRTVDLLHVASAICTQATEFYSFDHEQNELAVSQGLKAPLFKS